MMININIHDLKKNINAFELIIYVEKDLQLNDKKKKMRIVKVLIF